jgi:hypothetical protein
MMFWGYMVNIVGIGLVILVSTFLHKIFTSARSGRSGISRQM